MSGSFGDRLRAAREQAGLSQKQLAARVNTSTAEVSFWEVGRRVPSAERQASLLAACASVDTSMADAIRRLLADYERDLRARLGLLHGDLQTLAMAERVTPAAEAQAMPPKPTRRRVAR